MTTPKTVRKQQFAVLLAMLAVAGTTWAAVNNGDGTMTVTPTNVTAGSTGNSFTFSCRNENNGAFTAGAQLALIIPAGWTAPQITTPGDPGYVSIAAIAGVATATNSSVTGTGPWTVLVNFTANQGPANGFDLAYAGGGTAVTAPTNVGTYTFATQTKKSGGTLTAITTSPTITVTAGAATQVRVATAPDGSGTLLGMHNMIAGESLTVYSVACDAFGNY